MKNNRYKCLLHQTTWWMQPGLSHLIPSFYAHPHSLSSPSRLRFHWLYMSLFGNRGGLQHSLTQLPYRCVAASSVFPSWHWHYIHSDIIWGKVLFLTLSFLFSLSSALSLFPPAVVSTGTLLSLCPQELSKQRHSKANAWDFQKQTASILCCSPICG